MVVKRLMRFWRPWPPASSSSSSSSSTPFTVHISVLRLEGDIAAMLEGHGGSDRELCVWVELRANKGSSSSSRGHGIMQLGRNEGRRKRFSTSRKRFRRASDAGGIITWEGEEEEEAFESRCVLDSGSSGFLPYHVYFAVIVQIGSRAKVTTVGTSVMDLGELVPSSDKSIIEEHHTTTTTTTTMKKKKKKKLQLFPPDAESAPSKSIATLEVSIAFSEGLARQDDNRRPDGGSGRFMAHPLRCLSGPLVCVVDQQMRESYERKLKAAKRSVSLNRRRASISGELDADLYKSRNDGPTTTTTTTSNGALDLVTFSDLSEDGDDDAGGADDEGRASSSSPPSASLQQQQYCNLSSIKLIDNAAMPEAVDSAKDRRGEGSGEESESSSPDADGGGGGSVMGLLPWRRKRKLGLRSPPKRGKPLLNKGYGEDGGDDIDRDRRLSAGAYLPIEEEGRKALSSAVDFGEEGAFSVGAWEAREVVSRDGRATLRASVFFASIDQRSERAGGESACAALVAVIADWLHGHPGHTPNRAEFDALIRQGSDEWRRLSGVDRYKREFPDLHFDLDTVLAARVRDVAVRHDRSFVGFFALDGARFRGFFDTALSFDDVWEAIGAKPTASASASASEPAIYIVSWNDHFFVFQASGDACYIIDTLGERLHEGCNEAYIVRFDADTTLVVRHAPPAETPGRTEAALPPEPSREDDGKANVQANGDGDRADLGPKQASELRSDNPQSDDGSGGEGQQEPAAADATPAEAPPPPPLEEEHRGKDACKHFLKRFFASVPLAELEADVRRGLVDSLPLHKLQIDFHYTSRGG